MLPFFRRGGRLDGGGESFRPQGKTKRLVFLTKDFCFCRNCLLLTKRALFLTELFLFALKPFFPQVVPAVSFSTAFLCVLMLFFRNPTYRVNRVRRKNVGTVNCPAVI